MEPKPRTGRNINFWKSILNSWKLVYSMSFNHSFSMLSKPQRRKIKNFWLSNSSGFGTSIARECFRDPKPRSICSAKQLVNKLMMFCTRILPFSFAKQWTSGTNKSMNLKFTMQWWNKRAEGKSNIASSIEIRVFSTEIFVFPFLLQVSFHWCEANWLLTRWLNKFPIWNRS